MVENFEYSISPGFFGSEEIALIRSEFNKAFGDSTFNYTNANLVELDDSQVAKSEILSGTLEKILAHFTDTLGVSGISLAKVWLLKSQPKDTDPNKLPYLPHFDKHRYLKAMIYLHDVDEEHGPIHFGELRSPSEIDVLREALPEKYKELGLNTIRTSELKGGMEPITGKKGDVVFFDTNAAHCAGIVSEGFERHVIRFDFDVRGFNRRSSSVKRFLRFISSRIN